jgi:hypothetical protein
MSKSKSDYIAEAISLIEAGGIPAPSMHSSGTPVYDVASVREIDEKAKDGNEDVVKGIEILAYEVGIPLFQRLARKLGVIPGGEAMKLPGRPEAEEEEPEPEAVYDEETGINIPVVKQAPKLERERIEW